MKTVLNFAVNNGKQGYTQPEIKIRKMEMADFIANSVTNINDGGGDGPGYGGGGGGPAYAPKWGNLWDDSEDQNWED